MCIGFKAMRIFFYISVNFLFSFVLNSLGRPLIDALYCNKFGNADCLTPYFERPRGPIFPNLEGAAVACSSLRDGGTQNIEKARQGSERHK